MKLEVERNKSIISIRATDLLKLRLDWLEKADVLQRGTKGRLHWYERSETRGAIGFQVTETGLDLNFQYKLITGEWKKINQHILIVVDSSTEIWRSRFVCEVCETVVDELLGFDQLFLCRHCQPISVSHASSGSEDFERVGRSRCEVVITQLETADYNHTNHS